MRRLIGCLLLSLILAPTAHAKLSPTFSERVAEPGETVELDLGKGVEQFVGPVRIYLAPLEAVDPSRRSPAFSNRVTSETDARLVKIGELGRLFGPTRSLRFEVPDVPAGEYTAAIWYGRYAPNALVGVHPLLTIGAAAERTAVPRRANSGLSVPAGVLALAIGLGAGLFFLGWRRRRLVL